MCYVYCYCCLVLILFGYNIHVLLFIIPSIISYIWYIVWNLNTTQNFELSPERGWRWRWGWRSEFVEIELGKCLVSWVRVPSKLSIILSSLEGEGTQIQDCNSNFQFCLGKRKMPLLLQTLVHPIILYDSSTLFGLAWHVEDQFITCQFLNKPWVPLYTSWNFWVPIFLFIFCFQLQNKI